MATRRCLGCPRLPRALLLGAAATLAAPACARGAVVRGRQDARSARWSDRAVSTTCFVGRASGHSACQNGLAGSGGARLPPGDSGPDLEEGLRRGGAGGAGQRGEPGECRKDVVSGRSRIECPCREGQGVPGVSVRLAEVLWGSDAEPCTTVVLASDGGQTRARSPWWPELLMTEREMACVYLAAGSDSRAGDTLILNATATGTSSHLDVHDEGRRRLKRSEISVGCVSQRLIVTTGCCLLAVCMVGALCALPAHSFAPSDGGSALCSERTPAEGANNSADVGSDAGAWQPEQVTPAAQSSAQRRQQDSSTGGTPGRPPPQAVGSPAAQAQPAARGRTANVGATGRSAAQPAQAQPAAQRLGAGRAWHADALGGLAGEVCCVCVDHGANVLLVPCGHQAMCKDCAKKLAPPRCPVCRHEVQHVWVVV